jgi:dolichyl-phosphate-mannose-protein mannosyltransferase
VATTLSRPEPVRQAWEVPDPEEPASPSPRLFAVGVAACTLAAATFLAVQLDAWPPHEDETLALFIGRQSLGGVLDTVLGQRGGAPLHFLFAWAVAHLGGGLMALRACSAAFAVASIPVCALLARRLAGQRAALFASVIVMGSWLFLFHGAYGRMYSLFLLTSTASYLVLLRAVERSHRRDWAIWAIVVYLTLAAHTYGALVLASHALFIVSRGKVRAAAPAFAAIVVAGIPFWLSDLVLRGRYEVGVGGEARVGGPELVLRYLWQTLGDFTSGYGWALLPAILVAVLGLVTIARRRAGNAVLAGLVFATPTAVLLVVRFSNSTSPETRHLVFLLPFFAICIAAGLARLGPLPALVALALLLPAQIAWGERRTPMLYHGESHVRVAARDAASAWIAARARPDDVLLGYDPLFLQAWERGGAVSKTVIPRADPKLMDAALRKAPKPLGHGFWVLDASDLGNDVRRLSIEFRYPSPREAFEVVRFGPFLVVHSRRPTATELGYLARAWDVQLVGKSLHLGDAYVNYDTVRTAIRLAAR